MAIKKGEAFVLGLDYGTDSCRAMVIDAGDGSEAGVGIAYYPRWKEGRFCNAGENRFRQHPLDYIDALEISVREALNRAGADITRRVKGIAIDTTGSTPCAVDETGLPLALKPEFAENPSAMFILWKDHTAVAEAERINALTKTWGGKDFTQYEGGIYSPEWFWAKILRVFDEDPQVAEAAASFLEHCDWMTALLTGVKDIGSLKRSRCAMGHKAMWHAEYSGYPTAAFFSLLDLRLVKIRESLGRETYTSDQSAGPLCGEWAVRLGLPLGIPVAVGAYDAHMGAVGGGVKPGRLVKVMGTSTCDVIVGPGPSGNEPVVREHLVRGICGQVDGSVIPGMLGYEAGQSAFGDVYAWFKKLLLWPVEALLPRIEGLDDPLREWISRTLSEGLIPELEKAAARIEPGSSGITALDWLNGRRTPDANPLVKGAVVGLTLGSDAPRVYRALAEATAFGSRAIVERFQEEGVVIEEINGIGGVARKSPFMMQLITDVLNMPINILASDQSVALGAAMFAAVAAGLYPDIPAAQAAMGPPVEKTYVPDPARVPVYDALYKKYRALGTFVSTL
ncbi:MAG: ribulokinase [Treponema sp.]|jgi:L-ribulokinase|nr:ribulokinase [Treponema sp.]